MLCRTITRVVVGYTTNTTLIQLDLRPLSEKYQSPYLHINSRHSTPNTNHFASVSKLMSSFIEANRGVLVMRLVMTSSSREYTTW